ncbi:MAG TPA: fibronectin type III domain-containing protein [Pseudonocardiaceae bacterium]
MTRIHVLGVLVLLIALAGCGSTSAPKSADPPPSIQLTATLVSPTNIALSWHDGGTSPAGHIVEYATAPNGPFTILGFLPASQTTYAHRDLMPTTAFYYRVRPFYGPASHTVDVALPPGAYNDQDQAWATPRSVPQAVVKQSVRDPRTASAAAPTNLTATVVNPNGIKFAWTDHASDADGYLVESKPAGSPDFNAIQLLGPDINTCGVVTLPTEKNATYQIRAFYYGQSSNVAHQTTGNGQ